MKSSTFTTADHLTNGRSLEMAGKKNLPRVRKGIANLKKRFSPGQSDQKLRRPGRRGREKEDPHK